MEEQEAAGSVDIAPKGLYPVPFWGLSSVGRAPALQAGGREFESLSLHSGVNPKPRKEGIVP